jgi:translation initiation factor 2 beta subunit (eIF-2beta)/eIF-5
MEYTEDFLIARICKNIDKTGTKISITKPIIEKKDKKTLITNYQELCNSLCNKYDVYDEEKYSIMLNKKCQELKIYFENEMNLTSSILSSGILCIDYFHQNKDIIATLTNYINNYIICPEPKCKSGKTEIVKLGKLYFLTCKTCNAKKTIEPIKKK